MHLELELCFILLQQRRHDDFPVCRARIVSCIRVILSLPTPITQQQFSNGHAVSFECYIDISVKNCCGGNGVQRSVLIRCLCEEHPPNHFRMTSGRTERRAAVKICSFFSLVLSSSLSLSSSLCSFLSFFSLLSSLFFLRFRSEHKKSSP